MDPERLTVHDLDLLGLRKAPADDLRDRFWAQTAGALFGGLASVDSLTRVDFHEIVLAALEDRLSRWKGRGQGG